jgi:hypothetical protein
MKKFWIIGISVLIWSCKAAGGASDGGQALLSNYQEDLSISLPEYPDFRQVAAEPVQEVISSTQAVDDQLTELRKKIYDKHKSEPFFSGFTVLIYSGIDRNTAFRTRDELATYFPDMTPEMQYQQPRYLVKVGQYSYKVEAQHVFSRVKAVFPSARIMQDRFQRKEYVPPVVIDPNAPAKN